MATYLSTILADSPAGFWRLMEAPGASVAADDSGNSRPGSYNGSPTLGIPGPLADGSTAMTCDGVDDYVDVPDNAAFDATGNFSIEIWFKTSGISDTNGRLFYKRVGGNGYGLHMTASNGTLTFECETAGVNNQLNTTVTNYQDGQWHYVVALRSGANGSIYIDGALVAGPTALTANSLANTAVLRIGSNDTVNRRFVGSLFGAAYYGSALTGTKISTHYAARLLLPVGIPTFTINGTDRTSQVHVPTGIDLSYTLGGRAVARLRAIDKTVDTTATAYSPDIDETVSVAIGTTTLFAGRVMGKEIGAIVDPKRGVSTDIDAVDYSAALDQRLISKTFSLPGGWTTKSIINDIVVNYLAVYGITIDAGMATGSGLTSDLIIDNLTIRAALNRIATLNNWIWRLLPGKVLQAGAVGTFTASYSLTTANGKIVGGVSWRKQRTTYANTIIVIYGGERVVLQTISITGTGAATSWPLDYTPLLTFTGDVVSQGVVTEDGTLYYPLFGTVAGVTWSYNSGTNSLTRSPALPAGHTAVWQYAVQFPQKVTVQDAGEVAAKGPYELQIQADDIVDLTEATNLANAELVKALTVARVVTIRTDEAMAFPGDVITLTVAERSLSGSWLIIETRVHSVTQGVLIYELTCLEGTTATRTWIDYINEIFGGSSASASAIGQFSGGFIPAPSGIALGDVIANSALDSSTTGAESSLRGLLNPGITKQGPALQLGRPDNQHTWAIIADYVTAGPVVRTLMFSPWYERGTTTPYAMALTQNPATPVAGEYYLVPYTSKKLWIGGDPAVFGGSTLRVEGVFARAMDVSGITTLSGGQLAFPATQNPSSNANTLDDYEEASWTPGLASAGGGAPTYSVQVGRSVKVGRRVDFWGRVTLATLGTLGAGAVTLTGLPHTSDATTDIFGTLSVGFVSNLAANAGWVLGRVNTNGTTIALNWIAQAGATSVANLNVADLTATFSIIFGGCYYAGA